MGDGADGLEGQGQAALFDSPAADERPAAGGHPARVEFVAGLLSAWTLGDAKPTREQRAYFVACAENAFVDAAKAAR